MSHFTFDKTKEIISLDIDGVINSYPSCLVDYANLTLNQRFFNDISTLKKRLSINDYKALKHAYRMSDYKYNTNIPDNVKSTINKFGGKYSLIFLTKRPFSLYPEMHERTLNWLKSNDISHLGVFEKNNTNFRKFAPRVHVDDQLKDIKKIHENNLNTIFLILGNGIQSKNIHFINTLDDSLTYLNL